MVLNLQTVKLAKEISLLKKKSGPDLTSKLQEKVHQHTGLKAIELLCFQVGHKVIDPECLYLRLRSVEVGKRAADDLVDTADRLRVVICVAHHQICHQDVERRIRFVIILLVLELFAVAVLLQLVREMIDVVGDDLVQCHSILE
jgi:hypothetical protein